MSTVLIRNVGKSFGGVQAVGDVSFTVPSGSMTALLGPSGCGKSTLLSCIAGLENIDAGEILIDGTPVSSPQGHIPPEKRNVGLIFQSYAVWPHMTVFENIAYGLKIKKVCSGEIRERVQDILDLLGLQDLVDRPATDLSGGQQQRVALARSLVTEPKVLLLDEPLSNLDAKLRERMRGELRSIQQRLGITAIFVTHDQLEAMAIADQIVVMRLGHIQQIGTPHEVYNAPTNLFTADFIGECNIVPGLVESVKGCECTIRTEGDDCLIKAKIHDSMTAGDNVSIAIRPEDLVISPAAETSTPGDITGRIAEITYLGDHIKARITTPARDFMISIPSKAQKFKLGGTVRLTVDPVDVKYFPASDA